MELGPMMCSPGESLGLHQSAVRRLPDGSLTSLSAPRSPSYGIQRVETSRPSVDDLVGRLAEGVTNSALLITTRMLVLPGSLAVKAEWSSGPSRLGRRRGSHQVDVRGVNCARNNPRATFLQYIDDRLVDRDVRAGFRAVRQVQRARFLAWHT